MTMTRPKHVRRRKLALGRRLLVAVFVIIWLICDRLQHIPGTTQAQQDEQLDVTAELAEAESEATASSEDPAPPLSSDASAATTTRSSDAAGRVDVDVDDGAYSREEATPLGPIVLTGRSFDKAVGDGHLWLVAFMAPWCSHCRAFEPTYDEIARYFHGPAAKQRNKRKVKVGKVDADAERALAARFEVPHYPSFYVVDGWNVYRFGQTQSKKTLIRFAEGDYKKQDPIPFYSSPVGPWGMVEGMLMAGGASLGDLFSWLQAALGLSPLLAGALLFGSIFMGCFVTIVVLAIVITPKVKVD